MLKNLLNNTPKQLVLLLYIYQQYYQKYLTNYQIYLLKLKP